MQHLIEQLKEWRQRQTEAQHKVNRLQEILETTKEWEELEKAREHLKYTNETLSTIDNDIRQTAIVEYQQTGNKKPAGGVSVVINKKLRYDVSAAIEWATLHATQLLKLDKRAFEKHARATLDTVPLEFVEVDEVPGARVAKELE